MAISKQNAAVVFSGPERAELHGEPLREPEAGEILVRTTWSLISTGTECTLYGRKFEDGSRWNVTYPSRAGYSHVGVVEAVGPAVKM